MTRYGFGLAVLFLSAIVVTASGCERKFTFIPVEGTVTQNGLPLRDVEVVFLADPATDTLGPRAIGRTDEAGHYRLQTDQGDKGAVVGTHLVVVRDLEAAKNKFIKQMRGKPLSPEIARRLEEEEKKMTDLGPRVPPSYESITETPLHAKVGSEPLVFDITVP